MKKELLRIQKTIENKNIPGGEKINAYAKDLLPKTYQELSAEFFYSSKNNEAIVVYPKNIRENDKIFFSLALHLVLESKKNNDSCRDIEINDSLMSFFHLDRLRKDIASDNGE